VVEDGEAQVVVDEVLGLPALLPKFVTQKK